MQILNRDLSTPTSAGFEFLELLQGDLIVSSSLIGETTGVLEGTFVVSSATDSLFTTILEGTLEVSTTLENISNYLEGTLVATATGSASLDSEVFGGESLVSGTLIDDGFVVSSDLQETLLCVTTLSGELLAPLGETLIVSSYAEGYLAPNFETLVVADTTVEGELLLCFAGSLNTEVTMEGGIDIPDYISGELIISSDHDADLQAAFSSVLSGNVTIYGTTALTFASDLAGTGEGIVSIFPGDTFLQTATDLACQAEAYGFLLGETELFVSKLRRLDNIKLVNSIRRD